MRYPISLVLPLVSLLFALASPLAWPESESSSRREPVGGELDRPIPELADAIRRGQSDAVSEALAPCLSLDGPNGALEQRCTDLYSHLAPLDQPFVDQLNAWLGDQPENVHARLIATGALITRAWTQRGHAPEDRIHPMYLYQFRQTLLQAADQAAKVIELAPELPYGYAMLTAAYGPLGENHQSQFSAVLAKAEQRVPWSYHIALTRLLLAQPDAGGAISARQAIIDIYQPYRAEDPYSQRLEWVATVLDAQARRRAQESGDILQQVETDLVQVIEQGLDRSWVYRELAAVRQARGDRDGAQAAMDAALAGEPYGESNLFSALCTCDRVSAETALKAGRRYVERYPESFSGWVRLAAVHRHYEEDRESALAALKQARSLRPDDPSVLLAIRDLQKALGRPVDGRFDTRDYKQDLVVYSHRGYAHIARVREQVKARFGGQFDADNRGRFNEVVELYFTEKAFDTRFRLQLETLDWDDSRWAEVAMLFADSANIAAGVSPQVLNQLRAKYSQPQQVEVIREIYTIRDKVTERMVQDFIEQLNDSGSST